MARKQSVFFRNFLPILKLTRLVALLACLVLFLGRGVLPAWTQVPIVNPPIVKSLLNAPQLLQQGRELYKAGNFSKALTVWQQAAEAYQAQRDMPNQAMVLSNISLAYQQLGQLPQATAAIAKSLKLLSSKGQEPQRSQVLAQALNTQGNLQLALGQSEQALTTWQQAATAYTRVGDSGGSIQSQINQAQALQALGLYRRALVTLESVNQTLRSTPDSLLKVASLRSLGNALRVIGDLERSPQVLQQSLALAQNCNRLRILVLHSLV